MQNLKMSIARHGSQCERSTAADRPWKSYFPAREITPDYLPKRDGFYADPILPILNFVGTGDKVRLSPTSAASFAYAVSTGECVTLIKGRVEAGSASQGRSQEAKVASHSGVQAGRRSGEPPRKWEVWLVSPPANPTRTALTPPDPALPTPTARASAYPHRLP